MNKEKGFTLMEVLVASAIAGLVITAGFRLIGMSYKLMSEIEIERQLIEAARDIWLRFRIDEDMPENGTDDKKNITWRSERISVPVDDYELKYRRVTVSLPDNRSTVIYVTE
ncbi:MAG: prepilin-type N-terminal cleavage/methylation domain-containing protein [Synergistales bacterium]|nr:prepilin-type N-terminal cleavage/methylation domain-containing protein [Synergistaceae bacterium]MDY6400302.1 prepilin-type N-terminal cleavage/methylation domain-containing protein [Synergistales bacterium]MDY6401540.1 prepilin-type N-terminal cleavage/methylation domain-containing protein [Synergistales bacterium]MDY6404220.1 prepilin-type N-terminal cleavage/methylation domain-containing protein [Synergistales bacterium]MDY6411134.1 prepilin-type N-terminal cleavage/methylation domain-co